MDFVVKSGRAVVYPIYKNTYERAAGGAPAGPNARRDIRIQGFKDFGRVLDYIETRVDLDRSKLAFFGASQGAGYAGIPLALDPRMKTAILQGGGLPSVSETDLPGEVRVLNFLPRVKIPVLMLNGKHDYFSPVEETQKPLFQFLGTPDRDKRHVLSDSGHSVPRADLIREILPWLDRYLGPVQRRGS
jgi:dipeptidyl aminopeptidase/acylaminoacyl peptidase